MITKSELQSASRELIAEAQKNIGPPPTDAEILAYSLGKLSEVDEERVREWLVANPDLARMYGEPFPEEPKVDAVPAERGGVVYLRQVLTSVAAVLALVFGALYWQAEIRIGELKRQVSRPLALGEKTQLFPDGRRGVGGPTPLPKEGDAYHLVITLINQPYYDHYRIDLIRAGGSAPVWSITDVPRQDDDSFELVVPHAAIPPGTYQLFVFGLDGKGELQLGSYRLRVR
jgi:hypothetical protein